MGTVEPSQRIQLPFLSKTISSGGQCSGGVDVADIMVSHCPKRSDVLCLCRGWSISDTGFRDSFICGAVRQRCRFGRVRAVVAQPEQRIAQGRQQKYECQGRGARRGH